MITNTEIATLQDRWAHLRSHRRVVSRVKLLVEWEEGSSRQRANGITVDVSESGCMAVVSGPLQNGKSAEAKVVWRDHEAWDVGLELVQPDASFWGVKI